ncbi:hypothetical protein [Streptomyces sp. NRRL F-5123]|uniref:hypothetical protein n=1 Tax=Streptomyces sp. NRRL F-5123 TaxID=1463856 RepID=UPI0004E23110|nr:hypothetical protein [Streptomyces sp. NRRL F-5123]
MKAEPELTDDEHLRALAVLEAVLGNDDTALNVLSRRGSAGPGERALPELLAAYGHHAMHHILLASYDIDADHDPAEAGRHAAAMDRDPFARLVHVLIDTLHQQAALAGDDPATAKAIGATILKTFAAFTAFPDHTPGRRNEPALDTPEDAQAFLQALRDEVLARI